MAGIYDEIEAQRVAAKTAFQAGEYDEAIKQAELSLLGLSLVPDGRVGSELEAEITWNREAIVEFINLAKKARSDAAMSSVTGLMSMHPIRFQSERCGS